jgi:short-subunit dehydrogenase
MGRAIAHHFAQNNYHVMLLGRTFSKLETVAQEIVQAKGTATPYALDLTDAEAIQHFAKSIERADCLVNCAGESFIQSIETTQLIDLERILSINLKAPFLMSQALLTHLRHSENPSIINIGSKTSVVAAANVSVYTAAKTGLLGLTRAMSAELRPENIRVVMLNPGPVDTPMRWAATPHYNRDLLIHPQVIAQTVYHLATLPRGITTSDFLLESLTAEF